MKLIGIDLDGTLATQGQWAGIDVIGPPIEGAELFLSSLVERGWTICLWTTRARVYAKEWADKYGFSKYISFYNESPYPCDDMKQSFDVYVGDEAIRFDGDYDTVLKELDRHQGARHWGTDTFDRDYYEGDRNPSIYYKGTGKLFLDCFGNLTREICETRVVPDAAHIAFLTICSHAKPYYKSWIHSEIRKRLFEIGKLSQVDYIHISSAGVIPSDSSLTLPIVSQYDWNSAEIEHPDVKDALFDKLVEDLRTWYDITGRSYNRILVYLRPNGNTLRAVKASGIPCKIYNLVEYDSPEWVLDPDVDDCLADIRNLSLLEE